MLSTAFTYINAFKEGGVESNHMAKLRVVCLQNIANECNYNPRCKCKRSAGLGNGAEHSMRKRQHHIRVLERRPNKRWPNRVDEFNLTWIEVRGEFDPFGIKCEDACIILRRIAIPTYKSGHISSPHLLV